MLGLVLGALLAAAPLTPEGLEQEAAQQALVMDALLTRAARRLARPPRTWAWPWWARTASSSSPPPGPAPTPSFRTP